MSTLYDPDGFQVANSLNPFAVSSWMPFKHDPDGSLTLYLQKESGKDKEANWLPAPKGAFNLTMRLYSPKSESLTGRWNRRRSRRYKACRRSRSVPIRSAGASAPALSGPRRISARVSCFRSRTGRAAE